MTHVNWYMLLIKAYLKHTYEYMPNIFIGAFKRAKTYTDTQ